MYLLSNFKSGWGSKDFKNLTKQIFGYPKPNKRTLQGNDNQLFLVRGNLICTSKYFAETAIQS